MNSDGKTWSTVDTRITKYKLTNDPGDDALAPGFVFIRLTPMAAGVYKYRVTYDGDGQYALAISNIVTLTVTAATWQR
jgi:hypothetical protein